MQKIIMVIMAVGALLGGVDRLTGNRLGLGKKSEEALDMLGAIAASMAGILCLTPLLTDVLGKAIVPIYRALGFDPSMFASILAIDMGGYEMAMGLADDPTIGAFSGIVVAAIFGCTISFSVPVGMGLLKGEDADCYSRGMLCGLAVMPLALIAGGLFCGLSFITTVFQLIPVMMISVLLLLGLIFKPKFTVKCFSIFAQAIRVLTIIGLTFGAVQYMSGWTIIPGLMPIEEAMAVCTGIAVVLMGSLPMAHLLQSVLKKPLQRLADRLHMATDSVACFLITPVSMLPTIALYPKMDKRGKIVNAAYIVCATSGVAAHLGYCASSAPKLLLPMLAAKFIGGVLAIVLALVLNREERSQNA